MDSDLLQGIMDLNLSNGEIKMLSSLGKSLEFEKLNGEGFVNLKTVF